MKENVFFDLDGTLTDPGIGITNSVLHALSFYGIREESRSKLNAFIGPPLVDSFQSIYGFSHERALEAIGLFREYFEKTGIFENALYDGVPEMLRALKEKGATLILATSKPELFALRILDHFGILSYFDFVCGATMDEKERSTKEEVLSYALKKSGADPRKSVMVGDRKYDILSAHFFGLSSVGVLYGYGSREELSQAGAQELCQSVEECKEVLLS